MLLQSSLHAVDIGDAESCGEYGDLHALAQFRVDGHAPLDFEVAAELVHEVVYVVHFLHHEVVLAALLLVECNGEKNLLRVEDVVVVEQWRVQCIFDGLLHSVLAFSVSCRHDGHAAVLQYCAHIVEVEVDDTVNGDDFRDRLGGHGERVVGLAESCHEREVGIDLTQTLVVDDEQCVNVFCHLLDAVECLVNLLGTLEAEGYGDDADGEDAHLL